MKTQEQFYKNKITKKKNFRGKQQNRRAENPTVARKGQVGEKFTVFLVVKQVRTIARKARVQSSMLIREQISEGT